VLKCDYPVWQPQQAETAFSNAHHEHVTRKLGLSEIESDNNRGIIPGLLAQSHRRIDGALPEPLEITYGYAQTGSGFTEKTDLTCV
jgi:hypothetical protein